MPRGADGRHRLEAPLALGETPGRMLRLSFRGKRRIGAYRNIARGVRSAQPMKMVLRRLWGTATDDGRRSPDATAKALAHLLVRMNAGWSFGRAVNGWCPVAHELVIAASNRGGDLAEGLERAARLEEAGIRIKAGLVSPLGYVVFLASMAFGLLLGFSLKALPLFEGFLPREEWTGAGASLASLADFVTGPGPLWILGGLVLFVAAMRWVLPNWTGRARRALEPLQPFKTYRALRGAGFMMAFSSLVKAGDKMSDALGSLSKTSDPWLKSKIDGIHENMRQGQPLATAMWNSDSSFPSKDLLREMMGASVSGDFEEAIAELADRWVDDTVVSLARTGGLLRNVGLLSVAMVVAVIIAGIFSVTQQMQSGMGL